MMPNDILPGFYGKLPSIGDFVSRRLPFDFIRPWDQWLQEALYLSKEKLGPHFTESYQSGPIWRFVLGPDCCGGYNAAGILTPSWDRVGRSYPLVIAVLADIPLLYLMVEAGQWFSQLENLADLLLQKKLGLKKFDSRLQQLKLPLALFESKALIGENSVCPANGPLFLHIDISALDQMPEAFEQLTAHLLKCQLTSYSIWVGKSTQNSGISVTVFKNLPPPDRFIDFLARPTDTSMLK